MSLHTKPPYVEIDNALIKQGTKHIFLVCGKSIKNLPLNNYFTNLQNRLSIQVTRFSDFEPNPTYDSVLLGLSLYKKLNCDLIFAVGGGSGMDVAKCIKVFSTLNENENYLTQPIVENNIPLWAIPTTAGSGSEATRYAIIYYKGEKQSVVDFSCIPSKVFLEGDLLKTLPIYQKKATVLDAICQCMESIWCVHSTEESKKYAFNGLSLLLPNVIEYSQNNPATFDDIMMGSYLAGKAINISQTTAGHALCYKLTTHYGIAHGHAVALACNVLWPYMLQHIEDCTDVRGKEYLQETFTSLGKAFNCNTPEEATVIFSNLLQTMDINPPKLQDESEIELLTNSVAVDRLANNPIKLSSTAIEKLYREIMEK